MNTFFKVNSPIIGFICMHSVVFILKCFIILFSVFLLVDFLRNLFSSTLGLGSPDKVLDDLTLDGVAQYIKSGKCESAHPLWLTIVDSFTAYKPVFIEPSYLFKSDISLHPHR